jgi:cytochrome P450
LYLSLAYLLTLGPTSSARLTRKALKDFTFSDGTVVPKNTFVCAALWPIHHDRNNYTNPDVFDGFRFANMSMSAGESGRHQLVGDHNKFSPSDF